MTKNFPPPLELIPNSAPFTAEQRQWLSGFFAGLISADGTIVDHGITALSAQEAAALMPSAASEVAEADDGAPWHDQTLPLAGRMRLAEGRPLRRRMMAAMAQQDCGQCGYNCQDYADALFARSEERLNLCVPGGKETARMLKALHQDLDGAAHAPSTVPAQAKSMESPRPEPGRSRDNPVAARFVSRTRLNKSGSRKETWHVEFDIADCALDYAVGDSLGIYPTNDPALVDAILKALDAPADFPIGGRALRDVLIEGVALSPAPDMLFQLVSYITGGERRQKAKAFASGEDPDGDAATLDVLAAIEKFRGIRPDPEAFVESLDPLAPRLYSISSSPKVSPGRVSTTVDAVRYQIGARRRLGVASTFLADRISSGGAVKIYLQKAQHFGLPADPRTAIVMIGPGTGIAPFRAFLHERMKTKAPGPNWLFFGHQQRDYDFFYEDELVGMKAQGVLTRLTLAWSRDGDQKIYVQDRMREVGRDLWAWLADGAYIYVCGDSKHMAKDVERTLVEVVAQYGVRSTDEAIAFVAELKKRGRYQQDVY